MLHVIGGSWTRALGLVAVALAVVAVGVPAEGGDTALVGKNPGKIQGRWLDVKDVAALKAAKGVYIGDIVSDIQWKKESNEAPIDEELLDENLHDQLLENLRTSSLWSEILTSPPEEGAEGYLRLDCNLTVEPGSRAMRYVVGMGAGKSRSVLEIHIKDHASGAEVGLYHGYGVGSGMGFKLAGGGARKMTQDDIQENTKEFVTLVGQVK
jgi:hypothetical protein